MTAHHDDERYPEDPGSRVRLVAAAYVLLLRPVTSGTSDGAEVLLHLRRGTGYRDGHWALVAGHVEAGESVVDAAAREAREEVGVEVATADLVPLTAMHRTLRGGGPIEQRLDVFFAAYRWTGHERGRDQPEHSRVILLRAGRMAADPGDHGERRPALRPVEDIGAASTEP